MLYKTVQSKKNKRNKLDNQTFENQAFILTLIAEDSAAAFVDVAVSGEVHLVVSVGAHQMASVADSAEIFIQTLEEVR